MLLERRNDSTQAITHLLYDHDQQLLAHSDLCFNQGTQNRRLGNLRLFIGIYTVRVVSVFMDQHDGDLLSATAIGRHHVS